MLHVTESVSVGADADAAWRLMGDAGGLAGWHPAVASAEMRDDHRSLVLADGARVEERITQTGEHSYDYEILDSPLPVRDYVSKLSVEADGGGSTITWTCDFEADGAPDADVEALLHGFYRAGLDSAAQQLH